MQSSPHGPQGHATISKCQRPLRTYCPLVLLDIGLLETFRIKTFNEGACNKVGTFLMQKVVIGVYKVLVRRYIREWMGIMGDMIVNVNAAMSNDVSAKR